MAYTVSLVHSHVLAWRCGYLTLGDRPLGLPHIDQRGMALPGRRGREARELFLRRWLRGLLIPQWLGGRGSAGNRLLKQNCLQCAAMRRCNDRG